MIESRSHNWRQSWSGIWDPQIIHKPKKEEKRVLVLGVIPWIGHISLSVLVFSFVNWAVVRHCGWVI